MVESSCASIPEGEPDLSRRLPACCGSGRRPRCSRSPGEENGIPDLMDSNPLFREATASSTVFVVCLEGYAVLFVWILEEDPDSRSSSSRNAIRGK
jgi:hypothetical protein